MEKFCLRKVLSKRFPCCVMSYYIYFPVEKHSADVRDSIFRVPHQSEFFVVADLTNNSRLHSSLAIFDLNVSYSDAWFFSYNALHTGDGSSYPGLGEFEIARSNHLDRHNHSLCSCWSSDWPRHTGFASPRLQLQLCPKAPAPSL